MPKPNYQYEKRQRELAKKAKKAEKAARKVTRTDGSDAPAEDAAGGPGEVQASADAPALPPGSGETRG